MAILNKISYAAIAATMLTGCYSEYTPDFEIKHVLCINSIITAGEPITVNVRRTWTYTEDVNYLDVEVKDAVVEIYANGDLQIPEYIPQEGDHIRVVAYSDRYGRAEGEVIVPVAVPIESLVWEAKLNDSDKSYLDFDVNAKLAFLDPSDRLNFYNFSYATRFNMDDEYDFFEDYNDKYYGDTSRNVNLEYGYLSYESEPLFSEHIGIYELLSGMTTGFTFFTDRQLSGDTYTMNLNITGFKLKFSPDELSADEIDWSLRLTLETVSESYYNFMNYQWMKYSDTIVNLEEFGLSDPTWGNSNVSSGAGVIAAKASTTCEINLKDFFMSCLGDRFDN